MDTRQKRAAVVGVGRLWYRNPHPSNMDAAQRAAVGQVYPFTGGPDVTAPTLTSPTASATGPITGTGSVVSDEAGTGYYVVTTVNGLPSVAQIQAGQDSTGTTTNVDDSGSTAFIVGINNINFTGLTADTTYYVYFQEDDAIPNSSTVVGTSFSTTANSGGASPSGNIFLFIRPTL